MSSPSLSLFLLKTPVRRAWRPAIELLVARGWTAADLFSGIEALGRFDRTGPTATPHRVAARLYEVGNDAAWLERHGVDLYAWDELASSVLRSEAETAAILTVAEEFWRYDVGRTDGVSRAASMARRNG